MTMLNLIRPAGELGWACCNVAAHILLLLSNVYTMAEEEEDLEGTAEGNEEEVSVKVQERRRGGG